MKVRVITIITEVVSMFQKKSGEETWVTRDQWMKRDCPDHSIAQNRWKSHEEQGRLAVT